MASFGLDEIFISAVLTGVLHHFLLQYPRQAGLFTTVLFFLVANLIFAVSAGYYSSPGQLYPIFGSSQALLWFCACYFATALSLKLIYNVFFRHRGIPTSFWLASTDLLGYLPMCWTGRSHTEVEKLHKNLGDIIRIQPNHISFNSLEAVDAIHGIKTKASKGQIYTHVMRHRGDAPLTMFSETDKKRHGFFRRIANPFFSQTFLRELEPTIQRYYQIFVDGICEDAKQNQGIVDLTEWIDHLVLDVSGALTLGVDLKALELINQRSETWVLSSRWIFVSHVYAIPWIMPLTWLMPFTAKTREADKIFNQWIFDAMKKMTENKEVSQKKATNYLDALLRVSAADSETGDKLSRRETVRMAAGFIVAAGDTTGSSLVFILYHCLAKKTVWERLRDEVRSKFNSSDEITGQATAMMPYLDAIIHEGTRLRPAAPANLIRETPPEGMLIAGHWIAGNTQVSTPTWTILHDERHFSNPHEFIPERWIESERGAETCNKKAYIPFSTGLRNCIGQSYDSGTGREDNFRLAMLQMRMLVARFAWSFDAELVDPEEPLYEDRFAATRGTLRMRIKPVARE